MPWYEVTLEDTSLHGIQSVKVNGRNLCLINNEGQLYATQRRCPHAGGDLSAGWCEKGKLVCPLHRYSYDLHTGKGSDGQGDYINTYPVKFEDGKVFVQIDSLVDKLKRFFIYGKPRD